MRLCCGFIRWFAWSVGLFVLIWFDLVVLGRAFVWCLLGSRVGCLLFVGFDLLVLVSGLLLFLF